MTDCIFCKIIKGEIPASIVYEDDKTLAFLDIAPNNFGHTLVISKEHHENLIDTPDDTLAALMSSSKKVANAIMKSLDYKGFNLAQNNFKVAGQVVPHIHFHIIPRTEDDDFKLWSHKKYPDGKMDEVKDKIIKQLK